MAWKDLVEKGKAAYPKFKAGKKAFDYLKLVKGAIEENTRDGSLFKLGVKATMDIASKVIGTSLTSHPYFTYHKAHIEILSQALNMLAVKEMAEEAFKKAVTTAAATEQAATNVASLEGSVRELKVAYAFALHSSLALLAESKTNPARYQAQLKETGMTDGDLRKQVAPALYDYRAAWAGLADEALQLTLMVAADVRGVDEAMTRYEKKLADLKSGKTAGNLGRIAGYRLEQDRQWAELDAHRNRNATTSVATFDPRTAAQRAYDKVETLARDIATRTDAVFDDSLCFDTPDRLAAIVTK